MNLRRIIRNILEEAVSGNGIIAYHGSPHGFFDKFDISKRGEGADLQGFGDYGNGFYFTPDKQIAINYAKGLYQDKIGNEPVLYTVKLKMNNPFNFDKIIEFDRGMNALSREYGNVLRIPKQEIESLYDKVGTTEEELDFVREIESKMSDNWGDWDIAKELMANGYDSVINPEGNEYVVFDSSQIEIINRERVEVGDSDMLDEAMVAHDAVGDNLALFVKGNDSVLDMTLYDPKEDKVYGHIGINKLSSGNWAVGGVAAERGYGPLMYELAMSQVYPGALMPTRDGDVRGAAEDIWNRFMSRGDVKKEIIRKKDSDFPEEYYEDFGGVKENPGSEFMFRRYYYNGAGGLLKKLKKKMFEYLRSGVSLKDVDRKGNEYWLNRYD